MRDNNPEIPEGVLDPNQEATFWWGTQDWTWEEKQAYLADELAKAKTKTNQPPDGKLVD